MKRILMGALLLGAAACAPADEDTYDLSTTGIDWHEGMSAVKDSGKPILLFQLLGDLDDVYC